MKRIMQVVSMLVLTSLLLLSSIPIVTSTEPTTESNVIIKNITFRFGKVYSTIENIGEEDVEVRTYLSYNSRGDLIHKVLDSTEVIIHSGETLELSNSFIKFGRYCFIVTIFDAEGYKVDEMRDMVFWFFFFPIYR